MPNGSIVPSAAANIERAERAAIDIVGLHDGTGIGDPIMAARRSRSTAKKKARANVAARESRPQRNGRHA
jgi:hypothetical protein